MYSQQIPMPVQHPIAACENQPERTCLSCGTTLDKRKKRYCSIACRQRLRHKLNMRTGLLKALNIRYAAFHFTENVVILDVLPYGGKDIFSFLYPRSPNRQPADDFSQLTDLLGNAWWAEKKRTNRSYLACRYIFGQAKRGNSTLKSLKPQELKIPSVNSKTLVYLQLDKNDLESPRYKAAIKNAFRMQAKKNHPDVGGSSAMFRKIHQAYEELINWAECPTFVMRSGFPDKWFYRGDQNRWVQPIPENRFMDFRTS